MIWFWILGFFLCVLVQVLKATLIRHGFTFKSETDTEVIPILAKFVYDKANEVAGKVLFQNLHEVYIKSNIDYVLYVSFFNRTNTKTQHCQISVVQCYIVAKFEQIIVAF